jgi:hypothetical protein
METSQRISNEYIETESASMLSHHDVESTVGGNAGATDNTGVLGRIARSKVRWGVVTMPAEWHLAFTQNQEVQHLSFGVEEDEVSPSEPGRWYV